MAVQTRRRFEKRNPALNEDKFWQIDFVPSVKRPGGVMLLVSWGRRGSVGQSKPFEGESDNGVLLDAMKRVEEKLGEGYREVVERDSDGWVIEGRRAIRPDTGCTYCGSRTHVWQECPKIVMDGKARDEQMARQKQCLHDWRVQEGGGFRCRKCDAVKGEDRRLKEALIAKQAARVKARVDVRVELSSERVIDFDE